VEVQIGVGLGVLVSVPDGIKVGGSYSVGDGSGVRVSGREVGIIDDGGRGPEGEEGNCFGMLEFVEHPASSRTRKARRLRFMELDYFTGLFTVSRYGISSAA
jgi:hypothetical protein